MMSSAGMIALTWTEIKSWKELTGTELTPDEVRLIRELSLRYVSQYSISKDPNCPRPFESEQDQKSAIEFMRSKVFRPSRSRKK